jgi:V/A-type H+/Na+-transporting ATPase subunit I
MSLVRLKKIAVLTLQADLERTMEVLQLAGLVHLTSEPAWPDDSTARTGAGRGRVQWSEQARRVEQRLSSLQFAIDTLAEFEPRGSFVERHLHLKESATSAEFLAAATFDEEPIVAQLTLCKDQLRNLANRQQEILGLRHDIEPLSGLDIPLEELQGTRRCFAAVVRVLKDAAEPLLSAFREAFGEEYSSFVLAGTGSEVIMEVVALKEFHSQFKQTVEAQHAEVIDLSRLKGTASENLASMEQQLQHLEREVAEVKTRMATFVTELPALRRAYDYWQTRLEQLKRLDDVADHQRLAVVTGWVRTGDVTTLEQSFVQKGIDVSIWTADPMPDDDPPVEYYNPTIVRPFEFVNDLYGRPLYGSIDPSPYLATSFVLFFGICLTDAGYGLLLLVASLVAMKSMGLSLRSSPKLLSVLLLSGAGTIAIGIATGGFFGLAFRELPAPFSALDRLVLLDPMQNQMSFLVLAIALGVIHVVLGIVLKLYRGIRNGEAKDALLDQAPWLGIIFGALALVAAYTTEIGWANDVGVAAMSLSALTILLFAGRDQAGVFRRFAFGLFSLYKLSGLFGDVLSYSRLFALGLATGVIAGVVNFIAGLTLEIPYLGFIVMPLVLIVGHLLNLAINALSGFVHTMRLQFVEFFGKFYESGGVPFDSFRLHTRYTHIIDLPARP